MAAEDPNPAGLMTSLRRIGETVMLAPMAGFFIGRQWKSSVGWWRKALFAWRLGKKIYLAWNFLRPSAATRPNV